MSNTKQPAAHTAGTPFCGECKPSSIDTNGAILCELHGSAYSVLRERDELVQVTENQAISNAGLRDDIVVLTRQRNALAEACRAYTAEHRKGLKVGQDCYCAGCSMTRAALATIPDAKKEK